MAAKRRKSGVHSAGKSIEAEILANARALLENPGLAIVECPDGCVFLSPVRAAEAHIRRAHAARDDEKRLTRLASRGNQLGRAYAATLLVAKSGKVPVVGALRVAGETVPYAQRGKATPFFLAGLQHHPDRALRLLSVAKYVKSRGLHVYSTSKGLVCTGKKPAPPEDFVEEELTALGAKKAAHALYFCPHQGAAAGEALRIEWKSVAAAVELCPACASDENSLHQILSHIGARDAASDFEVRVAFAALAPRAGEAVDEPQVAVPERTLKDYKLGRATDAQVLEATRAERLKKLRGLKGPLYVAGRDSFGADRKAFIFHLGAGELEARALDAALQAFKGSVVVDRASPGRVLAEVWRDAGRAALEAASGDAEIAGRIYDPETPASDMVEALQRAQREGDAKRVAGALPRYRKLPGPAAAADAVVRALKARGREEAARAAVAKIGESRERGVLLAMLRALNAAEGHDWRFNPTDRETADALAPHVEALLAASDADAYHAALEVVARMAGSTDRIERA